MATDGAAGSHPGPEPEDGEDDPLFMAVCTGNQQVVQNLLRQGAPVNRLYQLSDKTAALLHMAAYFGHEDVTVQLLTANAEVDIRTSTGCTPLGLASQNGHAKVVQCLLNAGAGADLQDINGVSPLVSASQNGHAEIVGALLRAGADPNARTHASPLSLAAEAGHYVIVERLIRAHADANWKTAYGESSLFLAAQNGHLKCVAALLAAQADVDQQDNVGCSPLYLASQNGHALVVDTLIGAGASVDLQNHTGETPLYIAIQEGHQFVTGRLAEALVRLNPQGPDRAAAGDNKTKTYCPPLYGAAQRGQLCAVRALIEAHVDVNLTAKNCFAAVSVAAFCGKSDIIDVLAKAFADVDHQNLAGASPIHLASSNGHLAAVLKLIEVQGNVNGIIAPTGESPLHAAARHGWDPIVQALLSAGADPSVKCRTGETPLYLAAESGNEAVVRLLLEAQADPDVPRRAGYGESPIHLAAASDADDLVATLTRAQANVDNRLVTGDSALQFAAQRGHHRATKALVAAGADANIADETGMTPILAAAQEGHSRVVTELCVHANLDIRRGDSVTPLHTACQNGHDSIVQLLISFKADVNLQLLNGATPLFLAAQNGHTQIVASLIEAHADVSLQDGEGQLPILMAAMGGHHSVVSHLIAAQSDVNALGAESGISPLAFAAMRGHCQVASALLAAGADVNRAGVQNATPIYIAAENGHPQLVRLLAAAKANVNSPQFQGVTPIYIASQLGHVDVVKELIRARADTNLRPVFGDNAFLAASRNGYFEIANLMLENGFEITEATVHNQFRLLIWDCCIGNKQGTLARLTELIRQGADFDTFDELAPFNDLVMNVQSHPGLLDQHLTQSVECSFFGGANCDAAEVSAKLHEVLSQSGFVESRAALQSAAADVLQQLVRHNRPRLGYDDIFVVGSFSEGWGNSLSKMDGKTDAESDIDVTELIPGRVYHLRGFCQCHGVSQGDTDEYRNGHIVREGFASSPAKPENGSVLRPAVDRVSACRLCCYPPIAPLLPPRVAKSNIPQSVLQSLHQVTLSASSPCHVVHAAPPGQAGKQLRVSTTFLEKRLLRSLTTLQGQLFVTLKYLVKKVICHKDGFNVQGLKAYHAKTITFRMLEETPAEQWQPENLVSLTRRSLQMLLDSVESSFGNADGRIMEHFFLQDAGLYLKGADRSSAQEIARVLRGVMEQLHQMLGQFASRLKPLSNSGRLHFHPLHVIPTMTINQVTQLSSQEYEYSEVYNVVRTAISLLSAKFCNKKQLSEMIDRLPDCARSAREALRALACLKFGNRDAAAKVLSDCSGHEVSRGISWSAERSKSEATADFVWQHLRSCDSAWKFCFFFHERPEMSFLPRFATECFPSQMINLGGCFYMNFDALLTCLQFELQLLDGRGISAWFERLLARAEDVDPQEALMALHFGCAETDKLVRLLRSCWPVFTDQVKREAQKLLMLENPQLREQCMSVTVGEISQALDASADSRA